MARPRPPRPLRLPSLPLRTPPPPPPPPLPLLRLLPLLPSPPSSPPFSSSSVPPPTPSPTPHLLCPRRHRPCRLPLPLSLPSLRPRPLTSSSCPPLVRLFQSLQLLFSTLLAFLSVIYVPLFVSACWRAVSIIINKKLQVRLYMLAAAVVVALSVHVSALAFSVLWSLGYATTQGLALAAFVMVLVCVEVGEGILVIRQVFDALAVV